MANPVQDLLGLVSCDGLLVINADARAIILGAAKGDNLGGADQPNAFSSFPRAVAVGDFNADGTRDLAVGAPTVARGSGRARGLI